MSQTLRHCLKIVTGCKLPLGLVRRELGNVGLIHQPSQPVEGCYIVGIVQEPNVVEDTLVFGFSPTEGGSTGVLVGFLTNPGSQ